MSNYDLTNAIRKRQSTMVLFSDFYLMTYIFLSIFFLKMYLFISRGAGRQGRRGLPPTGSFSKWPQSLELRPGPPHGVAGLQAPGPPSLAAFPKAMDMDSKWSSQTSAGTHTEGATPQSFHSPTSSSFYTGEEVKCKQIKNNAK